MMMMILKLLMIWSRERERVLRVLSCLLLLFLNFSPKPTKTDDKEEKNEREFKKCERKARIFLSQNRFFSLWWNNCQKVKKRPHRHTKEQTFFPNTTKTTQHHSSCSLLLLTRFDHHHRSSRRMSPPNLLDHLRIDDRRWKSARWGWKKVRYCFRFRRLAS